MIEKMKKISMLLYHAEYEDFLNKLRELGVMHVEMAESELSSENSARISRINHLKNLVNEMEARKVSDSEAPSSQKADELIQSIESKLDEVSKLSQELFALQKEKEGVLPWGDFSLQSLEGIKEAGYNLQFFICEEKNWDDSIRSRADFELINKINDELYLLALSKGEGVFHPDLDEVKLNQPLSYFENQIALKNESLHNLNQELEQISSYAKTILEKEIDKLQGEIIIQVEKRLLQINWLY